MISWLKFLKYWKNIKKNISLYVFQVQAPEEEQKESFFSCNLYTPPQLHNRFRQASITIQGSTYLRP